MIPIQADDEAREYYVRNIISVWSMATDRQMVDGRQWYWTAHQTAEMLADGDVRVGAGLLAALSPQTAWWLNVELACEAYDSGTARRHTGDSCGKANKIMAGIAPEDVLPMQRKTGQFFLCIVDPINKDAVCIDRHAHDVAVGIPYGDWSRGLSTHSRYNLIANCYREAARRLGELPMVVQATTWVVWRDSLAGVGTRGSRV